MKKALLFSVLFFVGLHVFAQQYVPNQLILSVDSKLIDQQFNSTDQLLQLPGMMAVQRQVGVNKVQEICRHKGATQTTWLVDINEGFDVERAIDLFKQSGNFNIVEPNWIYEGCVIPTDPMFAQQYGCHNTGNFNLTFATVDSDADLPEAWDIEQGDSNVVVAVLDAGITFNHPEFAGRIWNNTGEIANNSTDDDLNGFTDDRLGWNFAYNNNDPSDDYGHGTASAGIIGANPNNGSNIAGIDWNCKIMTCKVLDSNNFATNANVADAIMYATDNGAHIINMSLAGPYSGIQENAVQYAWTNNVALFAATGNADTSLPYYPAAFDDVMAVGGSNAWDVRYIWSNHGQHMDVVAAADYIYIVDWDDVNNDSAWTSGTSLAAPFVSGVAALLKAQNIFRSNQTIYDIIRATAEDEIDEYTNEDTPGWDMYFGYGRVNAHQALLYDTLSSGIGAENNASQLMVYPNPATSELNLYFSQAPGEVFEVDVYNLSGQLVHSKTVVNSRNKLVLDVEQLPSGMYLLSIQGEEFIKSEKFLKQ